MTSTPTQHSWLPLKDARAIVRLLGEIASMPTRDLDKVRQELMGGLCKLVSADCWGWALRVETGDGDSAGSVRFFHGGFIDERFARYLDGVSHAGLKGMNTPFAGESTADVLIATLCRERFIPDELLLTSPGQPYWDAADLASVMVSARSTQHEGASHVGMFRRWGAPPFGERERKIVHIILSELPWLHTLSWPEVPTKVAPSLAPRERRVLELLVQGYNRKEIAEKLMISHYTVGDHVKSVYRKYGVNSLVGLLSRFRDGTGTW